MVMTKLPFTSLVVENFFPVRVLVAVTLTPGSGTEPDFTCPRIVPPFTSATAVGAEGKFVWSGAADTAEFGDWDALAPVFAIAGLAWAIKGESPAKASSMASKN